jgi:hypothetical protein
MIMSRKYVFKSPLKETKTSTSNIISNIGLKMDGKAIVIITCEKQLHFP